jgi:hypothetical protein
LATSTGEGAALSQKQADTTWRFRGCGTARVLLREVFNGSRKHVLSTILQAVSTLAHLGSLAF